MILDCVGSSFWEQNIKSLAVDGRWILYGLLGGSNVSGDLLRDILRKRASLIGTTLRSRSLGVSYYFFVSGSLYSRNQMEIEIESFYS